MSLVRSAKGYDQRGKWSAKGDRKLLKKKRAKNHTGMREIGNGGPTARNKLN